jgi:hypothetical protein
MIQKRLDYWRDILEKLMEAQLSLIEGGGVKSFRIEGRELVNYDLSSLLKEILKIEEIIATLEALLEGQASRKIVGVIPRDW